MSHLRSLLIRTIPKKLRPKIRKIYSLWYLGNRFICPCCNGHFRKFLPFGAKPRPNARCPRCDSLERHQLLWLYLRERTSFLKDSIKVLDIGPMQFFQEKCQLLPNLEYISADISSPLAMIQMDITDIPLSDNKFDCIICYHVLEHVPDDQKAMQELFRVLKPGGWAILKSPIDCNRKETFEDPSMPPEDRERVFGQSNHVRIYGLDYKDRLEKTGFIVKVDDYIRELPSVLVEKYGLEKDDEIYFCSKP